MGRVPARLPGGAVVIILVAAVIVLAIAAIVLIVDGSRRSGGLGHQIREAEREDAQARAERAEDSSGEEADHA